VAQVKKNLRPNRGYEIKKKSQIW